MSFNADFDALSPVTPPLAASRFDSFFDVYGLSLKQQADLEQRTITLIARSPASAPAKALAINLARFQPFSVEVNIIFAQIAPADALDHMVRTLGSACRQSPELVIRWAKNRALLDAHERLTLGRTSCWTGDAMRRSEDTRCALDRVDDCTPAMLAEANASFAYLWRASMPLPKTLFSPRMPVNMGYDAAPFPACQTNLSLEANIVRLEDYLRFRRH
ncbi:MAG: hypothetical protein WA579_02425 [Rhodomicrobium sp.]